MIRRIIIVGAICVFLISLVLLPAVREMQRDEAVKALLLTVQRAMQDYHVEFENYPTTSGLSGSDLIALLIENGHLEEPPYNPWTRRTWVIPDEPTDYLVYETDGLAESYALITYRSAARKKVHHTLDSSENQSLE